MAYAPKDNTGTLFRNDRREKDTHPHARGEAMIDGVLYEVAAWTKEGKNGKFQSLAFKVKVERQSPKPEPRQQSMSYAEARGRSSYDDDDSEAPF